MELSIISLGQGCDIKYQILKNFKNNNIKETQLFDWNITTFETVLNIISDNFKEHLRLENLIIDNQKESSKTAVVRIKNYSDFISMHDVPKNPSITHLNEYIEKYKRRYDRFIEILKKKNRLFLIRKDYNKIPSTDITKFFKKINKINPNNKIVLVLLCDYIKPEYLKLRNLLYINYKKLKKFESEDWKGDNYNWDYIVELLNNIFN